MMPPLMRRKAPVRATTRRLIACCISGTKTICGTNTASARAAISGLRYSMYPNVPSTMPPSRTGSETLTPTKAPTGSASARTRETSTPSTAARSPGARVPRSCSSVLRSRRTALSLT